MGQSGSKATTYLGAGSAGCALLNSDGKTVTKVGFNFHALKLVRNEATLRYMVEQGRKTMAEEYEAHTRILRATAKDIPCVPNFVKLGTVAIHDLPDTALAKCADLKNLPHESAEGMAARAALQLLYRVDPEVACLQYDYVGVSLREALKTTIGNLTELCTLMGGAFECMGALRAVGVLHLDLSPDNMTVREHVEADGRVTRQLVLIDFGMGGVVDVSRWPGPKSDAPWRLEDIPPSIRATVHLRILDQHFARGLLPPELPALTLLSLACESPAAADLFQAVARETRDAHRAAGVVSGTERPAVTSVVQALELIGPLLNFAVEQFHGEPMEKAPYHSKWEHLRPSEYLVHPISLLHAKWAGQAAEIAGLLTANDRAAEAKAVTDAVDLFQRAATQAVRQQLVRWVNALITAAGTAEATETVFDPWKTLWLFNAQVLQGWDVYGLAVVTVSTALDKALANVKTHQRNLRFPNMVRADLEILVAVTEAAVALCLGQPAQARAREDLGELGRVVIQAGACYTQARARATPKAPVHCTKAPGVTAALQLMHLAFDS